MKSQIFSGPLPPAAVEVEDPFWKSMMELVRTKVIPYQWRVLNDQVEGAAPSHCMANFRIAAGLMEGRFEGYRFQDTDLYKWLEAVAYSLMWHPDGELERTADEAIDVICAAQRPDGYLDTFYILGEYEKRFTNLMDNHELYCLGHLIEGAVAYYEATGKEKLLKAAMRFADHVDGRIGPEEGKLHGYPGHEVAEMGLVKLYRVTGEERYLSLAKYFIDERGRQPLFFDAERRKNGNRFYWEDSSFGYGYYQAHRPVREQDQAVGHAVRAMYLYSGMADVARLTGDKSLREACERLWNSTVNRQMYITGSIGSSEYGEAFTYEYDLPNDTAYGETCAAIGLAFFARRMLEIEPKAEYADVLERVLFNGIPSGVSLDGTRFFYVNPLAADPKAKDKHYQEHHLFYEREKWLGCACCPPNLARLTASISSYAYTVMDRTVYMHLYLGGKVKAPVAGGEAAFCVTGNYPWEGEIEVVFENTAEFDFALRVPGWCKNYTLRLNGEKADADFRSGYLHVCRRFQPGDRLRLSLPMEPKLMQANPRIREDGGKVALMRGPVVYCLEEKDNGPDLHRLFLQGDPVFSSEWDQALLGGVVRITCPGQQLCQEDFDENTLYRPEQPAVYREKELVFIPYFRWANRGENEMIVWVNRRQ